MTSTLWKQNSFKRLASLYAQDIRRVVVFSGAGASREVGLPDWPTFVSELKQQYAQNAGTAIAEALINEAIKAVDGEGDPWRKVSKLKDHLGGHYEIAVRNILTPSSQKLPTFHRRVWDINPQALLSVNLDGLSQASYAALRTGLHADYYTGTTVGKSRSALSFQRKLIVDLHGNVDIPSSWILTEPDRDLLLSNGAYLQFLRDMMSSNIVLFYGMTFSDISISGQISYFKDIDFVNGEYFLIKRHHDKDDWALMQEFPIQVIYMGDDLDWEAGFERFVDELVAHRAVEESFSPIVPSGDASFQDIPTPVDLLRQKPDEIRQILHSATRHFYDGKNFDYGRYKEFCDHYDSAIHLATRVNVGSGNNTWLGNTILSELGKGNFGRVYSASTSKSELIAIKVAHPDVRDDEAMLNSFRRGVESMRILSESDISGVVKIKNAGELPPSIVMEYVDGIDFEKYATDYYAAPVVQKLSVIKWVSDILFECHTHEKLVLHRDLRPSNIMISGDYWDKVEKEQINLLDFDLSWCKGASGSEFYMNAAQALGYLAPEQLNAGSKYSTRSALVDVYGMGMLLYFILSAEIPAANASTRTDWQDRALGASRKAFSANWKSASHRTFRLIIAATSENQPGRPSLQEFMDEIGVLIDIHKDVYPMDSRSIVEEIAVRLLGGDVGDAMNYSGAACEFVTPSGVRTKIECVGDRLRVSIDYTVSENTTRSGRGKYLQQSLDKARSAVKSFAEVDERRTSTELGRSHLKFDSAMPTKMQDVVSRASSISEAISAITIKA